MLQNLGCRILLVGHQNSYGLTTDFSQQHSTIQNVQEDITTPNSFILIFLFFESLPQHQRKLYHKRMLYLAGKKVHKLNFLFLGFWILFKWESLYTFEFRKVLDGNQLIRLFFKLKDSRIIYCMKFHFKLLNTDE